MNAICLVIDRLNAGYLGAYGNTWIETPALDRFACEGYTFDHAWSESPRLDGFYDAVWQGIHPLVREKPTREKPAGESVSLPRRLAAAGASTTLLTDEWAVAETPLALGFDELVEIEPKAVEKVSRSVEQTHAAECFARIIDWLEEADGSKADGPFFLWCHLSGLGGAWDAPYAFRERYAEEGDPAPPTEVRPPSLMLEKDYDPDTLLGITQSYAGQVSLFDTCIGALGDFITEGRLAEDTLLAIVSPRGYPLGEHLRVGPCDEALYGEMLHVPMMIRFPGGLGTGKLGRGKLGMGERSQALVTPADLGPTLLDLWDQPTEGQFTTAKSLLPLVRGKCETVRDRICMAGVDDGKGIRVPAWYLRMEDGDRLYAKPDDRWEVNDVADRCAEVVETLHKVADEFEQHVQAEEPGELSELDDVLVQGLE